MGLMGAMLSITGKSSAMACLLGQPKRLRELGPSYRSAAPQRKAGVLQGLPLGRAFKIARLGGSAAGFAPRNALPSRVLAAVVYFRPRPATRCVLAGVVLAMSLLGLLGYMDSSSTRAVGGPDDIAGASSDCGRYFFTHSASSPADASHPS